VGLFRENSIIDAMRSRIFLALWIAGILFPMGWLVGIYAPAGSIFNAIFGVEWAHVVAHMVLFTILAILIQAIFPEADLRLSIIRLVLLVILIAGIQEGLQHLTRVTSPGLLPSLYDLGVDLVGTAFGFGLFHGLRMKNWNFSARHIVKE
jgi:hypothetical protein